MALNKGRSVTNTCMVHKLLYFIVITRPRPKAELNPARFLTVFLFFRRCRKLALLKSWLVANRHSWDADWFAGCMRIVCMWRAGRALLQRSCKYEVIRSEMCLAWLYQLFSVPLILLTNAYAGCGRPTLNFVERFWFWLGLVRSASKMTQMNSQVNCKWTNKWTHKWNP